MVEFLSKTEFELNNKGSFLQWIKEIITSEGKILGDITYIFCNDSTLDKINQEYLNHEDLTDIISFDDTIGEIISGEIFISIERVSENSEIFDVKFEEELLRVMAHGILHFCGYKDAEEGERRDMRLKEDEKIKMFHVEHSTKKNKK